MKLAHDYKYIKRIINIKEQSKQSSAEGFIFISFFSFTGLVQKQESKVEKERKTFTAELRFREGVWASVQWFDATFPRGQFSELRLPEL